MNDFKVGGWIIFGSGPNEVKAKIVRGDDGDGLYRTDRDFFDETEEGYWTKEYIQRVIELNMARYIPPVEPVVETIKGG